MHIYRCVCFEVTFYELKLLAESSGATSIVELQDQVAFGHNCKMCHPYVRRMLKTGETSFSEIIREDDGA